MKRPLLVLLLLASLSACVCTTDTTPSAISSVSATDIGYSGATITWTTNEATTSQVEYGTTAAYGSTTTLNKTRSKTHTVELADLNPDTTYYYRVISRDASGNETVSAGKTFHTTIEEVYNREYEWDFMGSSWTYTTEIHQSDYDYFAGKPRVADYDEYVLNPHDDDWMENLAGLFLEEAVKKGWDESYYIPFALSFVQGMPYTSDSITTGYDNYPRYPVETIVDEGGDCEDTSILLASIVREMGYGVALLLLKEDEHMAVGVQIPQALIWEGDYPLTYYTSGSSNYFYCETTGEGWGIGEMPGELDGTTVTILDVF